LGEPGYIRRLLELADFDVTDYHRRAYLSHPARWYWRWTADFLRRHVPRDALILDAGCGYATFGIELSRMGFKGYHGIDTDRRRIAVARKLYEELGLDPDRLKVGDVRSIEGRWDVIIMLEVLYSLREADARLLLRGIGGNLKPGGHLIFTEFVKEAEPKPWRTYMSEGTVRGLLTAGGLEPVEVRTRRAANVNVWYAARRGRPSPRRLLLVTVDGDWLRPYAYDFYEKIITRYPFKFTASVIWKDMEDSAIHGAAADILSDPKVEVASHSYTHPTDWSKANPEKEVRRSVENINAFLKAKNIRKKVRGILWTGRCNPTEEAIAIADSMGLYNFNGKCRKREPCITVGERTQYLQRGFHDTWWRNKVQQGRYDQQAIEYFKVHGERPVHIYLHYHAVAPEHWPSVKAILDWAKKKVEQGELEPIWVSEWIEMVKEETW